MKVNVSIAGLGVIGFGDFSARSATGLADEALKLALDDCGLKRRDVDGLAVHIGSPRGLDVDEAARLLGLEVGFVAQPWAHGRFTATVLQHAAMAVGAGLANCVACVGVFRNSPFTRHGTNGFPGFDENFREGAGPHSETPHLGLLAPSAGAAMALQRYMHEYRVDRDKLAAVALGQRRAAALNPLAVKRATLTEADYHASPFVVEPLRRLDCSIPTDTAVVILMTSTERARDLAKRPVKLRSFQGVSAGVNEFVFGVPGLGIHQRDVFHWQPRGAAEPVFGKAGVVPSDIDTLHCYDGFSPQVLWTLERFGFAPPGEAADWVQAGRIEIGGELPVNTSGGHLSEGHANGWGHMAEIVRQLRGDADGRQIPDCRLALWATTFGDAILFERGN